MKIQAVVFCALVACGGGAKKTETANSAGSGNADSGNGTPCAQEIALVCPEGQIDACWKNVAAKPEEQKPDAGADESGGTGTAMALDECKMGKVDAAGTHHCVPK
jgi:hypothetical protein